MGAIDVSKLTAPSPLGDDHRTDDFRCSELSLEKWLKDRAKRNEIEGASRTYVVCAERDIVGYYCLSAGCVTHAEAPGAIKRNMPDPVPVIVLGRLAVHSAWVNHGIGKGLLKDALLRSFAIARELGARALICHAISQAAKDFYMKHGFVESPIDPMTLMLNLSKLPSTASKAEI